jgi:ubiquinone/menaquinone biosynthesis C-methylase UbiE
MSRLQRGLNPLAWFLRVNHRLSDALEVHLPQARTNVQRQYELVVGEYMNARPKQLVVDAGGGKQCWFAKYRDPGAAARIVAVDIDPAEMELNEDVDEKRLSDASKHLPFRDAEVDIVASRSMLEHLPNIEGFVQEAYRVLKPGGYTIHVFPSKYAPFSLLNRLLPTSVASRVVNVLIPGSRGTLGFPAFYDRTYAGGVRHVLERAGFEIVDVRVGYYQAEYFSFFFPLYVLNTAYELLVWRLGTLNLAAAVLVIARKPAAS